MIERIAELRAILGDEEQRARRSSRRSSRRSPSASATSGARRSPTSEDEIDIEDLIADQQMVITITKSGYIKSLPLATYRQQQRGGRGVTGMDMKDGDYIEHLFVCSSHDYLLFFSNRGKVYRSKVYELPEASRTAKGRALVNVLPLREGERIQSVLSTRDFSRDASTSCSRRAAARSRRPSSWPTTRRSRPTASSRSTSATTTSWSPCARVERRRRDHHGLARRPGRALPEVRRARDGADLPGYLDILT